MGGRGTRLSPHIMSAGSVRADALARTAAPCSGKATAATLTAPESREPAAGDAKNGHNSLPEALGATTKARDQPSASSTAGRKRAASEGGSASASARSSAQHTRPSAASAANVPSSSQVEALKRAPWSSSTGAAAARGNDAGGRPHSALTDEIDE